MSSLLVNGGVRPGGRNFAGITVVAAAASGAAIVIPTAGTVSSQFIVTAGAETNTLANPNAEGDLLILTMRTRVGGDRQITAASDIDAAGKNVITFNTIGDSVTLMGVNAGGALKWSLINNTGATLA